jgi:hypothetical protein
MVLSALREAFKRQGYDNPLQVQDQFGNWYEMKSLDPATLELDKEEDTPLHRLFRLFSEGMLSNPEAAEILRREMESYEYRPGSWKRDLTKSELLPRIVGIDPAVPSSEVTAISFQDELGRLQMEIVESQFPHAVQVAGINKILVLEWEDRPKDCKIATYPKRLLPGEYEGLVEIRNGGNHIILSRKQIEYLAALEEEGQGEGRR